MDPVYVQVCSCCNISKELSFYSIDKKYNKLKKKCNACQHINATELKLDFFKKLETEPDINWKQNGDLYFEKDTERIFNMKSGKFLGTIRTVSNMTGKLAKDLKYIAFHGNDIILENQVVQFREDKSIMLDNLFCDYVYCKKCEKIIEDPVCIKMKEFCSKRCQMDNRNIKQTSNRNSKMDKCLSHKLSIQKNINKKYSLEIETDYDITFLESLGKKCSYCNVECKFGNEKDSDNDPDSLTFDRKDSDIHYCKSNVVTCCWFCNRMKNVTDYQDWTQFISFIKGTINILDFSNKTFGIKARDVDISTLFTEIKRSSPSYYTDNHSARNTFIEKCKTQNYTDPYFNFFPIIYLERNCLFNASIDAIDPTLPNNEKHCPDNIQIVPKCFNYAKNTLSDLNFIKEWNKRSFRTDFTECEIKLPKDYNSSYFNKIIN